MRCGLACIVNQHQARVVTASNPSRLLHHRVPIRPQESPCEQRKIGTGKQGGAVQQVRTPKETKQCTGMLFVESIGRTGIRFCTRTIDEHRFCGDAAKPQIADPVEPIHREDLPNETAYIASEWREPPVNA